jgi:hypothetical protein
VLATLPMREIVMGVGVMSDTNLTVEVDGTDLIVKMPGTTNIALRHDPLTLKMVLSSELGGTRYDTVFNQARQQLPLRAPVQHVRHDPQLSRYLDCDGSFLCADGGLRTKQNSDTLP